MPNPLMAVAVTIVKLVSLAKLTVLVWAPIVRVVAVLTIVLVSVNAINRHVRVKMSVGELTVAVAMVTFV